MNRLIRLINHLHQGSYVFHDHHRHRIVEMAIHVVVLVVVAVEFVVDGMTWHLVHRSDVDASNDGTNLVLDSPQHRWGLYLVTSLST